MLSYVEEVKSIHARLNDQSERLNRLKLVLECNMNFRVIEEEIKDAKYSKEYNDLIAFQMFHNLITTSSLNLLDFQDIFKHIFKSIYEVQQECIIKKKDGVGVVGLDNSKEIYEAKFQVQRIPFALFIIETDSRENVHMIAYYLAIKIIMPSLLDLILYLKQQEKRNLQKQGREIQFDQLNTIHGIIKLFNQRGIYSHFNVDIGEIIVHKQRYPELQILRQHQQLILDEFVDQLGTDNYSSLANLIHYKIYEETLSFNVKKLSPGDFAIYIDSNLEILMRIRVKCSSEENAKQSAGLIYLEIFIWIVFEAISKKISESEIQQPRYIDSASENTEEFFENQSISEDEEVEEEDLNSVGYECDAFLKEDNPFTQYIELGDRSNKSSEEAPRNNSTTIIPSLNEYKNLTVHDLEGLYSIEESKESSIELIKYKFKKQLGIHILSLSMLRNLELISLLLKKNNDISSLLTEIFKNKTSSPKLSSILDKVGISMMISKIPNSTTHYTVILFITGTKKKISDTVRIELITGDENLIGMCTIFAILHKEFKLEESDKKALCNLEQADCTIIDKLVREYDDLQNTKGEPTISGMQNTSDEKAFQIALSTSISLHKSDSAPIVTKNNSSESIKSLDKTTLMRLLPNFLNRENPSLFPINLVEFDIRMQTITELLQNAAKQNIQIYNNAVANAKIKRDIWQLVTTCFSLCQEDKVFKEYSFILNGVFAITTEQYGRFEVRFERSLNASEAERYGLLTLVRILLGREVYSYII